MCWEAAEPGGDGNRAQENKIKQENGACIWTEKGQAILNKCGGGSFKYTSPRNKSKMMEVRGGT